MELSKYTDALMSEPEDESHSKCDDRKVMGVQVPLGAPTILNYLIWPNNPTAEVADLQSCSGKLRRFGPWMDSCF